MEKPYFIGIAGGSGSGKTYFLKELLSHFSKEEICVVTQDNYYKAKDLQPLDENGIENFDLPESIDEDRFYDDIMLLKSGDTVRLPEYTFNNPEIVPKILEFKPAPIILIEGILVFNFTKIARLFDLKIFVEAKELIKLKRRILRDEQERGYDLEDVLYRYEKHVTPVFEQYILPIRDEVDLIIPNNNNGFDRSLQVLVTYLRSLL